MQDYFLFVILIHPIRFSSVYSLDVFILKKLHQFIMPKVRSIIAWTEAINKINKSYDIEFLIMPIIRSVILLCMFNKFPKFRVIKSTSWDCHRYPYFAGI